MIDNRAITTQPLEDGILPLEPQKTSEESNLPTDTLYASESMVAKSRIPPDVSDGSLLLDPYDLRKDKIIPLFNADNTFNSAIKLDKPLKLEYLQRLYNAEYDDDYNNVTVFNDVLEPDYMDENFTIFERYLSDDAQKLPMPQKRPVNGVQRTSLSPRSVIQHYSGADPEFQANFQSARYTTNGRLLFNYFHL